MDPVFEHCDGGSWEAGEDTEDKCPAGGCKTEPRVQTMGTNDGTRFEMGKCVVK